MNKFGQRIKNIDFIRKLNEFRPMPVIWWSILLVLLALLGSLLHLPIVWRISLLFIFINCAISYHVGHLVKQLELKFWWLLLLPLLFGLLVVIKFANYNLVFCLIYLILELFGLLNGNIYN